MLWAVPLFSASVLATSLLFERGIASTPFSILALAISAGFLVACILIQKKSVQHKTRNGLIFLAAVLAVLPAGGVILTENNAVGPAKLQVPQRAQPVHDDRDSARRIGSRARHHHPPAVVPVPYCVHDIRGNRHMACHKGACKVQGGQGLHQARHARVCPHDRHDRGVHQLLVRPAGGVCRRIRYHHGIARTSACSRGSFLGEGDGTGMHGVDYDAAEPHAARNERTRAGGGNDEHEPPDNESRQPGDEAQTKTSGGPETVVCARPAPRRARAYSAAAARRQRPPRRQAAGSRHPEHAVRGGDNGATAHTPGILWKRRVRRLYNYRHAADHTDGRRVVRDTHRRLA